MAIVGRTGGIAAAAPLIFGSGFVLRGQALAPVSVQGVEPEKLDAISPISPKIVAGSAMMVDLQALLIGVTLADDLGLRVGQPVVLRSDRGRERTLVVRGIYRTGLGNLDERTAYVHIKTARAVRPAAGRAGDRHQARRSERCGRVCRASRRRDRPQGDQLIFGATSRSFSHSTTRPAPAR